MHIRFIKSIKIQVETPEGPVQQVFGFGESHKTIKLERTDNYLTIYLANGNIISGVRDDMVENYNTPTVTKPTEKKTKRKRKAKVEVIETEETPTEPIPINGTMLGSDNE